LNTPLTTALIDPIGIDVATLLLERLAVTVTTICREGKGLASIGGALTAIGKVTVVSPAAIATEVGAAIAGLLTVIEIVVSFKAGDVNFTVHV
jgi:hypothetical protein